MKIEELRPIERLAFDVYNLTNENKIKIDEVRKAYIALGNTDVVFVLYDNIIANDIRVPIPFQLLNNMSIEEYEKNMYSCSIGYVLQLINGYNRHNALPNVSKALELCEIPKLLNLFLRDRLLDFKSTVTGDNQFIQDFEIKSDGVLVTTDVDDEYFFPNEILSMDDDVAKEKYATTLKQIKEEKEKQYLVELKNEIKWYEKSLVEKKKHLEELEKLKENK